MEAGHKRGDPLRVSSALCPPFTYSVGCVHCMAPWHPHLHLPSCLAELPCIMGLQEFRAHVACPHSYDWASGAWTASRGHSSCSNENLLQIQKDDTVTRLRNTKEQINNNVLFSSCYFPELANQVSWHKRKRKNSPKSFPFKSFLAYQ